MLLVNEPEQSAGYQLGVAAARVGYPHRDFTVGVLTTTYTSEAQMYALKYEALLDFSSLFKYHASSTVI